ncbi:MAG: transcriptional regulator [Candidatus Sumerlaeia bacterium]|nr:transcriptional regulator [Candidatus Sumerlaeia bacterium]
MADYPTFQNYMREQLADLDYARSFLQVSLEEAEKDGDYSAFLLAMRQVIEIHGATRIARESDVSRRNIYKAFSEEGNPTLETLGSVLRSLGMKLSISSAEAISK